MTCVFFKVSSEEGTRRVYRNFYSPCRCALCRVRHSLIDYFARSIARHERGLYSVSLESSRTSQYGEVSIEQLLSEEIQMVAPHLIASDEWTRGEEMYAYKRSYPPLRVVSTEADGNS